MLLTNNMFYFTYYKQDIMFVYEAISVTAGKNNYT